MPTPYRLGVFQFPPDSLKALVDYLARQSGYLTGSECVRERIRRDQDRLKPRSVLLARASTSPSAPLDEA